MMHRLNIYKRSYVVLLIIVLTLLIVGLFLIVRENISLTKNKLITPMPTEISSNFSNQIDACFIPIASVYGYTLRVSSGFRGVEEQNQIYQQGRVVNGHIVTEAVGGRSIHNFGFAVDVVDRWRGYDIDFEKLGNIAEYCGLEHGDDGDSAHFEHRNGLSTDQLLDGFRPRDLVLPCAIMDAKLKTSQSLTFDDLRNCNAPKF